jgi:2-keto-4-pentenoate hydratase/2-oxohepta-3-ene-1,7-dioic acid hydratase in catechol pathway
MKLMSFRSSGRPSWGVVAGELIADVGGCEGAPRTLRAALDAQLDVKPYLDAAARLPLGEVEFLPVVTDPRKIICVGLNYEEHRRETGREVVGHPTLFVRFAASQVGHGAPLVLPSESEQFDYEGELALVIGKAGRYIEKSNAFDHVAGYACYNDASVRDWQRHTSQFTPGKNFVGTGGFGPFLVTPDETGPLPDLRIVTRLNGQIVQDATLGQMIFDIPAIISYCSTFTVLEPGDVIVTGTPGGVGMKRVPPLWMKPGDMVEVEIDRVGLLRNPVIGA